MFIPGDIILVRFPYSNLENYKIRPALVVSNKTFHKYNDVIVLGITSQKLNNENFEVKLDNADLKKGALPKTSYIRVSKISTMEKSIIIKKVAHISDNKLNKVLKKVGVILNIHHFEE